MDESIDTAEVRITELAVMIVIFECSNGLNHLKSSGFSLELTANGMSYSRWKLPELTISTTTATFGW